VGPLFFGQVGDLEPEMVRGLENPGEFGGGVGDGLAAEVGGFHAEGSGDLQALELVISPIHLLQQRLSLGVDLRGLSRGKRTRNEPGNDAPDEDAT